MSFDDYVPYLRDVNGYKPVQERMMKHFERFPDCKCVLWCARMDGMLTVLRHTDCDRCGVYAESLTWWGGLPDIVKALALTLDDSESWLDNTGMAVLCDCCCYELTGGAWEC